MIFGFFTCAHAEHQCEHNDIDGGLHDENCLNVLKYCLRGGGKEKTETVREECRGAYYMPFLPVLGRVCRGGK